MLCNAPPEQGAGDRARPRRAPPRRLREHRAPACSASTAGRAPIAEEARGDAAHQDARGARAGADRTRSASLHAYEVPEVVALPIVLGEGNAAYRPGSPTRPTRRAAARLSARRRVVHARRASTSLARVASSPSRVRLVRAAAPPTRARRRRWRRRAASCRSTIDDDPAAPRRASRPTSMYLASPALGGAAPASPAARSRPTSSRSASSELELGRSATRADAGRRGAPASFRRAFSRGRVGGRQRAPRRAPRASMAEAP